MRGTVKMAVGALVIYTAALVGNAGAQSANATADVEELMSAREFVGAGLQKLTPDELRALNVWLERYRRAVVQNVARPTTGAADGSGSTPELIETQIDDDFEGWDGDTIFRMRNGQIWQQSSYAYTYHYAYAPQVLIYRSGGGYKMKVEGISTEISVRRLK